MNFYEHQAAARRRTVLLGGAFVLAVGLIAFALNAVAFVVVAATTQSGQAPMTAAQWLHEPWWKVLTALVLLIVVGATLVTSVRLAGGGPALARMLRARRVAADTNDLSERRLVNVLEEMSIASGVPVPALYVLDEEQGINAFVAGSRASEAIMVVTRGALDALSRDELQGVVAHEYSHIFNHDMHLNIQLMGALAGLLVIGQIGRVMLHSGGRGSNRNGGQLALAGVAVLAIGYIGTFFGALIKAAISRQREYLADASAVQYTRNPDGIAGALYRIQNHAGGSRLDHSRAEDISHFCFGESVHYLFAAVMATHPPLRERIRRVHPGFVAPANTTAAANPPDDSAPSASAFAGVAAPAGSAFAGVAVAATPVRRNAAAIAGSVGTLAPAQLDFAESLHASLPPTIAGALESVDGAAMLMLGLALNATTDAHKPALAALADGVSSRWSGATILALAATLATLPARSRLPLIHLALPRLKGLDASARAGFLELLGRMINADRRFTFFEFVLQHILNDHLDETAPRSRAVRFLGFTEVARPLRLLLSVLAHAGTRDAKLAAQAYAVAWRPFALGAEALLPRHHCSALKLHAALDELAALTPLLKKNVIQACADCVIHDFTITAAEGELLQAVAISLDCPMPPLLGD